MSEQSCEVGLMIYMRTVVLATCNLNKDLVVAPQYNATDMRTEHTQLMFTSMQAKNKPG